jgi:hypothetical protein
MAEIWPTQAMLSGNLPQLPPRDLSHACAAAVLLDEAGQATEIASLQPLMYGAQR